MPFASTRMSGVIVIAALTLPAITGKGVMAFVGDPQRWSKPDVYLCILTAAYAIGVVAIYVVSPAFRHYCATRMTWWQSIYLNPYILLVISANWARYHDPIFPVFMLALIGWLMWRQSKALDSSSRAQRSNPEANASIPPIEPRGP